MLKTLDSAPPAESAAESVIIYDIAVLVNAVYQLKIEPTQAGYIPKRIVNKLRPQLKGQSRFTYEGTDNYTDMLFDLLINMRILQVTKPPFSDMKPSIEPDSQLASWSRLDIVEQMKHLLKEWSHNKQITDVVKAEFDPWDSYSYFYDLEVRKGRQALLDQLRTCVPGKWYRVDSLVEELWEKNPEAMRRGSLSKKQVRNDKDARKKWMKSDAQFYIGMLDSSLRDLGMVAVGYEVAPTEGTYRNPDTFMLSELAATVLSTDGQNTKVSKQTNNEKGSQGFLIVQPSFELLLLQPHLPTLYGVLPFAQVNQIGVASRLTLTKASLLRGMAAGYNIERIIQVLEEHSHKELPQNVVYTLRDWARQYKETRISQVLLLEVSSEEAIAQLSASTKFQDFGIRLLTPGVLAVNGDTDLRELRNALEKEGIAPHLVGNFSSRSNSSSRDYY